MYCCPYVLPLVALGLLGCAVHGPLPAEQATPVAGPTNSLSTKSTAPSDPVPRVSAGAIWIGEDPAKVAKATPVQADNGGLEGSPANSIARVITDNRQPFRDCYEQGNLNLPSPGGLLVLQFVIDRDGNVKNAELNMERSTITAPVVVDCALNMLRILRFPPSSGDTDRVVNYPFNFRY